MFVFFSDGNMGSVTHLVSNEQPLAVVPIITNSSENLTIKNNFNDETPVYSNILPQTQQEPQKNQNLCVEFAKQFKNDTDSMCNLDDLQLDPVVLHENRILSSVTDRRKSTEVKLDNDLTHHEKQNSLLSASRLRLLQDTTMIESALDLDSLDDSSIGTNSQAGLMKVV